MATAVEMGEVDELHSRDDTIKDAVVTNGDIKKEDVKESNEQIESNEDVDNLNDDDDTKESNEDVLDLKVEVDNDSNNEDVKESNEEFKEFNEEFKGSNEDLKESNEEIKGSNEDLKESIHESKESNEDVKDLKEESDDDVKESNEDDCIEEVKEETNSNSDEVMEVDSDNYIVNDNEDNQIENGINKEDEKVVELANSEKDVQEIADEDDVEMDEIEDITEADEIAENNEIVETETTANDKCDKDNDNTSVLESTNDSGENDVMIIDNDTPKENGQSHAKSDDNETTVISDDGEDSAPTPITKNKKLLIVGSPRRSTRNRNRRSYVESEKEDESDESDVEEIMPQDPLAIQNDVNTIKRNRMPGSTIVVKDTKRLVEIAAKTNPSNSGKKEPTLVIIDTNSILSGRGPVPLVPKPAISSSYPSILPAAVPAQGVYPPNMRATITPIPMNTHSSKSLSSSHSSSHSSSAQPILPSLTDDMFVVEAPSFIVPYVYEKPPLKDFKEFLKELEKEIIEQKKKEAEQIKEEKDKTESDEEKSEIEEQTVVAESEESIKETPKVDNYLEEERKSYFESPLCKFFIDIGNNLVQEFVQTDLLKQQKRKRDREQGQNTQTNNTIKSLLKSLEFSKENNEPYKVEMKRCEFCTFKTESSLAMAFHLETPHMKNYIYKCNFCPYEVRSPHDILFHMEAEHAIRGRLERAPAFHQCPNCPFEDNQKSKLSRHLVACMRKFRPEKNLEPPLDWEPPAKIPRVPRMKPSMNKTAALYQMAKSSLYDFVPKMQSNNALNRGRGRPTLGAPVKQQAMIRSNPAMIYKHSMSGGSVLVPTNYQMSGNHIYQVVGGQDLGSRINSGSPMALVPNISAAIQQQQSSSNKKPLHQPSISITPLPRGSTSSSSNSSSTQNSKPGDSNSKNSFVICEICDGYIKDLEQLRNHMQWIHKVKIHPKMIYNRPPLNCQKCQFRFFTDQGLERHLLGSHGLVTSSMQEAANKSKDAGRCPVCGRVYQWKLLNHVARDHNMTLKPAHLSYKCTVCTATFGMYKLFENHVYSAHSVVAKRVMDKKGNSTSSSSSSSNTTNSSSKSETLLKPLKINDEITIIPQQPKSSNTAGTSKEGSPSSTSQGSNSKNVSGPSTSKNFNDEANSSLSRAERLARRKSAIDI